MYTRGGGARGRKVEKLLNKTLLSRGVIEDGPYGGNGGGAWTDGGEIHLNGLPSGVDIRYTQQFLNKMIINPFFIDKRRRTES